jgi:serine/threonine protein phosphatase PrpC
VLRVDEQAFRSDTGRQRTANEDSYFASAPLFVVADGMGGAQAGEVASRIAAEAFETAERSGEAAETFLRRVAESANERIHGLAQSDSSRSGMGTTLTAALVDGDEVAIAHVGDSRAYLYREGELRLLTTDHSLVEELRRQGRLTEEQAEDHPQRSIITRALGPEAEVEVDTLTVSARPDDVFLLCSDGLTTMVKDAGIAAALEANEDLDKAVTELVEAANQAGGRDNITVVAFRLEHTDEVAIDEGATLIGPSAEEAGLSSDRIRAAAARRERSEHAAAPPPRRRLRTAVKVGVGLLLIAALAVAGVIGARQVYFLGVDDGGRVALYRGLPYELPLGINLYSQVSSASFEAASVPEDRQDQVVDHTLRSRDDAESLIDSLQGDIVAPLPQPPPGGSQAEGDGNAGSQDGGGQQQAQGDGGAGQRRQGSRSDK